MKTFRLALLGSVIAGVGAMAATTADAADVERTFSTSGWVNRTMSVIGDGNTSYLNFGGNDYNNSRLRFIGEAKSGDLTIGGILGFGFGQNNSQTQLSNTNANGTTPVNIRREALYANTAYGLFQLGDIPNVTDGINRADLSGTSGIQRDDSGGHNKNFYFKLDNTSETCNENSTTLCGPMISQVALDANGGQNVGIKYYTPVMAGVKLGVGTGQGGVVDAAAYYNADFGGTKVAGGIGYYNTSGISSTSSRTYAAHLSILSASGVSLTGGYGNRDNYTVTNGVQASRDTAKNYYGKIGYTSNFNTMGSTSFAVDYKTSRHMNADGDKYVSYGVGATQNLTDYGTELYAYARNHSLDRDAGAGNNYDNIVEGGVGARISF